MKKLLIIALLTCSTNCFSEELTVQNISDITGKSKNQIFSATKIWIAENFKSAKSVIENEDKEAGTIIGNANIKYPCDGVFSCMSKGDWKLEFTMKIDTKEQKLRITFFNLNKSWPPSAGYPAAKYPVKEDEMEVIKPALIALSDSLSDSVIKQKIYDNW
jgi:hypothetical protein